MSRTIRYPLLRAVPNVGPAEPQLVINILGPGAPSMDAGGADGGYADVRAWKTIQRNSESPYTCFALEFTATAPMTIGNGTFAQQIGLFGAFADPTLGITGRTLLGVLGIARGGAAPQIPIVLNSGSGALVGYTQMVSDLSLYDFLSVGSVSADFAIVGGTVTVRARPIRTREYLG